MDIPRLFILEFFQPMLGREWTACVAQEREIDAIPLQICTHPPGTPGYRDQIDIGQILDAG